MHLVNFVSGVLEHVEPVDRTFVISLVSYSKDSFAAGFPDGRVKTYKRVLRYLFRKKLVQRL
jgi:hypothetical protein